MIPWQNLGLPESAKQFLSRQPTVHELCYGGFLREIVQLDEDLIAIPLQPLGSDDQVEFLVRYARELLGAKFDVPSAFEARLRGLISSPVVSLVCVPLQLDNPKDMEASVRQRLDLARHVLSCPAAQPFVPFALFVNAEGSEGFYRLTHPEHEGSRSRILSIMELETPELFAKVFAQASIDETYSFALSLLHDAMAETNARFRIARLFNVLECLASENKAELTSRKAVRYLLGFPVEGNLEPWTIGGMEYRFDIIELAGRLRNKLFHGTPFTPEDLLLDVRPAFSLLHSHPLVLADTLTEYCRVALYGEVIHDRVSKAG